MKWRALRLDTGNYSWGSEAVTRKTRILDVVYNASNNELVRTQTLVKSAIIQVDAAPFKQWYLQHYGIEIGRKKKAPAAKKEAVEVLLSLLNACYAKILFHCSTMVLTSVISVFANVALSDIYSSLVIDDSLNEISVLFACCILC